MTDSTLPRLVYRPTSVVRVDLPGWDWQEIATDDALDAALADGWLLRPELPAVVEPEPVKRRKGKL